MLFVITVGFRIAIPRIKKCSVSFLQKIDGIMAWLYIIHPHLIIVIGLHVLQTRQR